MSEQQPNHPHPEKHDDAGRVAILLGGAVLIVVGLVLLGRQWLWPGWFPIERIWQFVRGAGWGLGLLILGILVIVWTQRPGFKPPAAGTRLYRSRTERMLGGVVGGLANYLSVDVTMLRLAVVALGLVFGVWPMILAYIIATIIVPEEPEGTAMTAATQRPSEPQPYTPVAPVPPAPVAPVAAPPAPPTAPAPTVPEPASEPPQPPTPVPPAPVPPTPVPPAPPEPPVPAPEPTPEPEPAPEAPAATEAAEGENPATDE